MKGLILTTLLVAAAFIAATARQHAGPVPIIFDTDMGPDYDDVGAIAILHTMADKGEAKILATLASTRYEGVGAVLSVFNTYFKRPGIPVGVPKGRAVDMRDQQHWTDTLLRRYPHRLQRNADAPDAIAVYRQTLAAAPDNSVTIVTVGFLTNLAGLLASPPDRYAPLSGVELVKRKVKQLVCMAGKFPAGKEFNIDQDAAPARQVFEKWPGPVLFSGFEIGNNIKTGLPLTQQQRIQHSPVKDVYSICIPMAKEDAAGRMSWDLTAVLVAVKGYSPWYDVRKGRITIAADGSNGWDEHGKGHAYLVEKMPPANVQALLNELMMR